MNVLLKIGLCVVSLVLVVVVGGVIFLATLDPNDYRDWVIEKFGEQTGRSLALEGEIGLTLYPWLGLSLNRVVVGNAAGFGDEPMFEADRAELRIKLMPLLREHYEIDTVTLHGARVNLAVDAGGRSNWADLAGEGGSDQVSSGSTGGFALTNFVIGGVDIRDASLVYDDRSTSRRYAASNLNLGTGELVFGAPIELAMTLDASASQPALAAAVELEGTLLYDLDNGLYQFAPLRLDAELRGANVPGDQGRLGLVTGLSLDLEQDTIALTQLEFSGLGTSLQGTINGSRITTSTPAYSGDLAISGDDLALLFRVAGVEQLASQLAGLNQRSFELTAAATADLSRDSVDVTRLNATLLGASLEGSFLASNISSERPLARGSLNASGPNLPLLVEVAGQLAGGRESRLSVAGRELAGVADRNFAIEANFDANLETGEVTVDTLDASLLGSSLRGNLRASEVMSEAPRIAGNLSASGPDLPLLVRIAGWFQDGEQSPLYQFGDRLGGVAAKAFQLEADFDVDLDSGTIQVPALNAAALGLQLSGSVNTRDMSGRSGTVNGSVTLRGDDVGALLAAFDQQDLAEVIDRVLLDVQISGGRSNLSVDPLRLEMVVAGPRIPDSPVTLELSAAGVANLDRDALVVSGFSVQGLGLDVAGNLEVASLFDAPSYSGRLEVASFDLRRFLQQLNLEVPQTRDGTVLQQVGVEASFRGSTSSIALDALELGLDETTLQGSVSIADFATLAAEFDLEVDQIDVDRYLAPATAPTPSAAAAPGAATEIPVDALRDIRLLGELRIGELTVAGLQMSGVSVNVNAADGQLALAPLAARLYDGSFEGGVSLSVAGEQPEARLEGNLREIDLEPLLLDLMDATYVSGHGNVQLTASGRGGNTDLLKRSLTGSGRVQLEDGVLTGVDVGSVLQQVEAMLRSRQVADLQRGEQTAFDSFATTLDIRDGIVNTGDLLIKAPGFQVAGRGTLLDLGSGTLDFDLVTSVDPATATRDTEQYDIGGYSVPIACTGALSSPRCLPDISEIVRGALQREVQRRVGSLLERAIGVEEPQAPPDAGQVDPATQQPVPEPAPTEPEQPVDVREELINRALDRIFR